MSNFFDFQNIAMTIIIDTKPRNNEEITNNAETIAEKIDLEEEEGLF